MKSKILLSVVASFCVITTTKAQINKGAVMLGGSIGYGKSKSSYDKPSNDSKTTSYNISPAVGVAIKQNLVLGAVVSYRKSTLNDESVDSYIRERKDNYYGGGIFIRQYIPIISRLYVIAEGDAGFNVFKTITEFTPYYTAQKIDEKGWIGSLGFTPGVSFAVNNKLHLETGFNNLVSIQYQKSKKDQHITNGESTTHSFAIGLNLENSSAFYLGFRILLNGKG
jgi:hypothetical protein